MKGGTLDQGVVGASILDSLARRTVNDSAYDMSAKCPNNDCTSRRATMFIQQPWTRGSRHQWRTRENFPAKETSVGLKAKRSNW